MASTETETVDVVFTAFTNGYESGEKATLTVGEARLLIRAGRARRVDADDPRTVDELKDELRKRDLPVSGSKPELLERLATGQPDA